MDECRDDVVEDIFRPLNNRDDEYSTERPIRVPTLDAANNPYVAPHIPAVVFSTAHHMSLIDLGDDARPTDNWGVLVEVIMAHETALHIQ